MAALDFPASPSNGQTYTGPGGVVWTWDGSKWVTQGIATAYLPLAGGTLTGVLGLTPGSASAPAANFGTANTGLYGATSSVGISTNGTARLTIDATAITAALPVVLPGAPTAAAHAATKGYVDGFLPLTGGTVTGPVYINSASGAAYVLMRSSGPGNAVQIWGKVTNDTLNRWTINLCDGATETGSNAGSNFSIGRFNDAGGFIDVPFTIVRQSGQTIHTVPGASLASSFTGNSNGNISIRVSNIGPTPRSWDYISQSSNGSWVLYDATQPRACMEVTTAGTCWNGTGTWASMSDERTKRAESIVPYTRGLADLVKLEPITFEYNGVGGTVDDGQTRYGFVAQQVQPVIPEVVETRSFTPTDPDTGEQTAESTDYLGIDPGRLMYAVVNALKEIEARLVQLEGTPAP